MDFFGEKQDVFENFWGYVVFKAHFTGSVKRSFIWDMLCLPVIPILIKNRVGIINDQTRSQTSNKSLYKPLKIAFSISNVTVYQNYFCCAYNKRVQRLKKTSKKTRNFMQKDQNENEKNSWWCMRGAFC